MNEDFKAKMAKRSAYMSAMIQAEQDSNIRQAKAFFAEVGFAFLILGALLVGDVPVKVLVAALFLFPFFGKALRHFITNRLDHAQVERIKKEFDET